MKFAARNGALGLIAWMSLNAAPAFGEPVIADIQVAPGATSTRIRIIASESVPVSAFVLSAPNRLVLDLPSVSFQLPPDLAPTGAGPILSYRYGMTAPDHGRIVFDLASPVLPGDIVPSVSAGGAASFINIYLNAADPASFEKAATDAAANLADKSPKSTDPNTVADNRPVIVIDPGHGGNDLGATGATGLFEKDVVLAFALALAKKIEKQGLCKVVLTRDQDVFIPLDDRVKFAHAHNAAVFLSIHGDTIASGNEIHGATVYVNDEKSSDAEAARVADSENKSDANAGYAVHATDATVADILGDLTLRETRLRSNVLAREIVTRIADTAHLNRNPLRAAGFRVLRANDIPSALIEIGYLSSKSDLDLLTSTDWTDKMTSRIADALATFLDVPVMAEVPPKP